jgi:hypothetical protein
MRSFSPCQTRRSAQRRDMQRSTAAVCKRPPTGTTGFGSIRAWGIRLVFVCILSLLTLQKLLSRQKEQC